MRPLRRLALPAITLAVLLLLGAFGTYVEYEREQDQLTEKAKADLVRISADIDKAFTALFTPTQSITDTVQDALLHDSAGEETERLFFALISHPMRRLPQVDGIYLGFPDGGFLQRQQFVPGTVAAAATETLDTHMGTRRLLRVLPDGSIDDRWYYNSRASGNWARVTVPPSPYDPRQRPWYQMAVASAWPIWTTPYTFASTGKLGVTYAVRLSRPDGSLWAVLGIDLALETLSHLLDIQQPLVGEDGLVFATGLDGNVIGHPALMMPILRTADAPSDADVAARLQDFNRPGRIERTFIDAMHRPGQIARVSFGGVDYIVSRTDTQGGIVMPMRLYLAQNLHSVTAAARETLQRNILLLVAGVVVLAAILAYAVKLRVEVTARQRAERALVAARDQAEAATRAKSSFLATMSHEIRTPMNGVMSMAELLGLTSLNNEQRRMTKVIQDSAQALLTVINDILDFSKIEAGRLEIERVDFSLADVIDGVGELLAPRTDEKMLELVTYIDPVLADLRLGDPTRLRQVLLNLGGNAAKFTHDGSVRISVQGMADTRDGLRFEIRDTGIGLKPDQMQRLFKPFEQADSSTARKYGGTGLGLSICQRLCELMGGRIGVDSTVGQGSLFWFELPLPAVDAPTMSRPDLSALRVLLIGLPPVQETAARAYLAGLSPARLVTVASAAAAKAAMADQAFDLVLVDARTDTALQLPALLGGSETYVLLAPRALVSTIEAAARGDFAVSLTYPLSAASIRRVAGLALGQIAANDIQTATRDDMDFAPPALEDARNANAVVLVAEDNATNRVVIRQLLSRLGFACEIAEDGAAAFALYERATYGLLLTDFHMPEMDGFALTAAIRAKEAAAANGPHLPIIALTADALTGTEELCLKAGMDGYLTKPVNSRALAAALQTWLPQALPLRRRAGDVAGAAAVNGAMNWDPGIFDATPLTEAFGGFDDTARQLLQEFVDDAVGQVDGILALARDDDPAALRDRVHSLKGAARSMGARRLGDIASDLQDACDARDEAAIATAAALLLPGLTELRRALPAILQPERGP